LRNFEATYGLRKVIFRYFNVGRGPIQRREGGRVVTDRDALIPADLGKASSLVGQRAYFDAF